MKIVSKSLVAILAFFCCSSTFFAPTFAASSEQSNRGRDKYNHSSTASTEQKLTDLIDNIRLIESQNNKISLLNERIDTLKTSIERYHDTSSDNVNFIVGFLGIVATIVAIAIGIFSHWTSVIHNRVRDLNSGTEKLLENAKKVEQEYTRLKNQIDSNIGDLYKKLHEERINSIFKALKHKPSDLNHYFSELAVQTSLQKEHYGALAALYLFPAELSLDNRVSACALAVQFFSSDFFFDPRVSDECTTALADVLMFKEEIDQVLIEIFQALEARPQYEQLEPRIQKRISAGLITIHKAGTQTQKDFSLQKCLEEIGFKRDFVARTLASLGYEESKEDGTVRVSESTP